MMIRWKRSLRSSSETRPSLSEDLAAPLHKGFRFDLCPSCHHKFLKDPLGKDAIRSFDFSKN